MEYLKKKLKKEKKITFVKGCRISSDNMFGGNNYIGEETSALNSSIGYGTYILEKCYFRNACIGKYCSIGAEVKAVSREGHPARKFVSTSPMFYLKETFLDTYVDENRFDIYKKCEKDARYNIIMGSDVWIGTRALLMGPLVIGDGAIIGAGAVVNKDVPPYAIVAGVPARIIGYRFHDEQIEKLMHLKWWDKPEEWIKEHVNQFNDIELFLDSIENTENQNGTK